MKDSKDVIKVKDGYVEHIIHVGYNLTQLVMREVWKGNLSMTVLKVDLNTAIKNSRVFDAMLTDYESIHHAKFTGEAIVSFSARR